MNNGGKFLHWFWGTGQYAEKKISRNKKIKARYFPGAKIKGMCDYALPVLEKRPENIILHLGTNDTPYKYGTNILKDLIELKDFILEKLPSCKKKNTFVTYSAYW